jgi:signal transduction histidine kinase
MTEPRLATEHGSWTLRFGDKLLHRLLLLVGLALLPMIAVRIEQTDRLGLLLIGVSGALTLGLTAWGAAHLIGRPMLHLLTASNRWAAGDFSARAGLGSDPTEFGRLGAALDSTAEALQARDRLQDEATAGDITKRRSLEAQLAHAQKLEAVGQLTSGIAHDFNNMLTAVSGNLELIGRIAAARADARTERLVDNAARAANRGAQLTSQLLAFARKQTLKTERIAVGRMLIEINELLRGAAGETVRVTMRSQPDLWACMADAALLEAALINLVINARDAMPDGGTLTIAASNATIVAEAARAAEIAPGDYVQLDVIDAGTGIAPELLPRMFEPFFTTKEVGRGSGLGLTMVQGFARQSGGAILVNSEMGSGTTMSLLLPRAHAVTATPRSQEPNEVSAAAPLQPGTVLLVEDDPEVLEVVKLGLVDAGHRVLPARDGHEALALLRSDEHIDLLLSDIMLPGGKGGVEVAREARRLRPGLCVLLSSGYSEHALLEAGARPDEFAILPKPFTRAQLLRRIAEAGRATRHSQDLAPTG